MEDVDACDLSGIRYAVNATLHDNEASFAFDEKCKEHGITVIVPWIDEAIRHYSNESFPQLAIGTYIAAGYCANILVNLAEGKEVKYFPKFYLSPLLEEI